MKLYSTFLLFGYSCEKAVTKKKENRNEKRKKLKRNLSDHLSDRRTQVDHAKSHTKCSFFRTRFSDFCTHINIYRCSTFDLSYILHFTNLHLHSQDISFVNVFDLFLFLLSN